MPIQMLILGEEAECRIPVSPISCHTHIRTIRIAKMCHRMVRGHETAKTMAVPDMLIVSTIEYSPEVFMDQPLTKMLSSQSTIRKTE